MDYQKDNIYSSYNNTEKPGFQLGIAKDFSPDDSGLKYIHYKNPFLINQLQTSC